MHTEVIYDNTIMPNELLRQIVGENSFGEIIIKKKTLEEKFKDNILSIFSDVTWHVLNSQYEINELREDLNEKGRFLHCFSDTIFYDVEKSALTLKKISYIKEPVYLVSENKIIGYLFDNKDSYQNFLKSYCGRENTEYEKLNINGMRYIGEYGNFVSCITGNFDSRYFNQLQGDTYTVKKISANKAKIKREYLYYQLLPESMKSWFVLPYDYRENEIEASYTMERLYMPDLAIKWIHKSIDTKEFEELLDKYFYFFAIREKRKESKEKYWEINQQLYVKKVKSRIKELKVRPEYKKIETLLSNSNELRSLDALFLRYENVKNKIESKQKFIYESVVGHGDPCFSNTLYNRTLCILKFIDPKGALTEDEMYTNPYYDIAKLSHSACGLYDYLNYGIYDLHLDENFEYSLVVPFDNVEYKKIFKQKLEENGYDYWLVRTYEASLFLSMLPLHIDKPQKVFAFILNAHYIMKEIEDYVQGL